MIRKTIQVVELAPPKKPILYSAQGEPLEKRNPVGFAPPEPEEIEE